ncbi:MAG: HAMP domain-containing protein [Verrucomicrobiae bacterium]|nr:HAMP domain-containing protein [Verrucomicrobiae bacterium]
MAPVLERRVFAYALPLDYPEIEWGWINVGLSLDGFNRSVTDAYLRTTQMAAACILLSLGASVVYARRLVRPILSLRTVVGRVAGGDLSAMAQVGGLDEIGALAGSVNCMTSALQRRDRVLESVRFAAQELLEADGWHHALPAVLAKIGEATESCRTYLFQNYRGPGGRLFTCQRFEWTVSYAASQVGNPALQEVDYEAAGFQRWVEILSRGEVVFGLVREMPAEERETLDPQGIRSLLAIPIHVDGDWWGFLGIDECREDRVWNDSERDSLRTVGDTLGATISRQRVQDALLESKRTLEERVAERTQELVDQVRAEEKARKDLAEAQQRLIEASRLAGKAEVATSVLHNVGNVLNSVGVSATLVGDRLRKSPLNGLQRAVAMLVEHRGELGRFLTEDQRGRILPEYFAAVTAQIEGERAAILTEIDGLMRNIEHIKKVVALQQAYATVSGTSEQVASVELVEDALRMNGASFETNGIRVLRDFDADLPPMNVDRHKVLQILVNLLRNAKHAVATMDAAARRIEIGIQRRAAERLAFIVRDSGIGIARENLIRVFQHGFTTKKNGHGFGLHSGANAAREMGGSLSVHSEGLGQGATFILELPIHPAVSDSHHELMPSLGTGPASESTHSGDRR